MSHRFIYAYWAFKIKVKVSYTAVRLSDSLSDNWFVNTTLRATAGLLDVSHSRHLDAPAVFIRMSS